MHQEGAGAGGEAAPGQVGPDALGLPGQAAHRHGVDVAAVVVGEDEKSAVGDAVVQLPEARRDGSLAAGLGVVHPSPSPPGPANPR